MECSGNINTPPPPSPTTLTSPSSPPSSNIVLIPCAACKILRRRCASDKCVLAPYFPPSEPMKFTNAHRVFGASNIIKLLQELPESQRADAVTSMVYEANARIRDPVYGCAGAICQLQKQINELQAQLAKAQAEAVNMQLQHSNLVALICMEISQSTREPTPIMQAEEDQPYHDTSLYFYDNDRENQLGISPWEALWT